MAPSVLTVIQIGPTPTPQQVGTLLVRQLNVTGSLIPMELYDLATSLLSERWQFMHIERITDRKDANAVAVCMQLRALLAFVPRERRTILLYLCKYLFAIKIHTTTLSPIFTQVHIASKGSLTLAQLFLSAPSGHSKPVLAHAVFRTLVENSSFFCYV